MNGPCAKRQVHCAIFTSDGERCWEGENECANPQEVCPRGPGEGYEKCKSICKQLGHAEEVALAKAGGRVPPGSSAIIRGHSYACGPCQEQLYRAGVTWISVREK